VAARTDSRRTSPASTAGSRITSPSRSSDDRGVEDVRPLSFTRCYLTVHFGKRLTATDHVPYRGHAAAQQSTQYSVRDVGGDQVHVRIDQAGNDELAAQVTDGDAGRQLSLSGWIDRRYAVTGDDDGHIRSGGRTGPVDDGDVGQR
jgi:hypothetical protein